LFETNVTLDLVIIIAAAAVGGLVARWLRQPVIVGYLIAGIMVGPFTPGPVASLDRVRFLTEIGVALLLFVMGSEMAPSQFRRIGGVITFGGILQIILTLFLGLAVAPWLDLNFKQGILLGAMLAMSSTVVMSKVLQDRREAGDLHGRIAIGISIIQDVASVPLLLLLLVFLGEDSASAPAILLALGKVLGLLTATYLLGRQLWPRVLAWVGRFDSRELMLLTTLCLALASALAVKEIGLSFAIGAFLAGLVIAESRYRSEAVTSVLPFRDVFAALFFVSIGMLLDPGVITEHAVPFLVVIAAVLAGKALVSTAVVRLFQFPAETALLAGLLLAQVGEFAFILGRTGLEERVIPESIFSLTMAAAVVSMMVNALLLDSAPPVLAWLARTTHFPALMVRPVRMTRLAFRRTTSGNQPPQAGVAGSSAPESASKDPELVG
jgi:CPA2 family monovalent cation:H+ antiporter-2